MYCDTLIRENRKLCTAMYKISRISRDFGQTDFCIRNLNLCTVLFRKFRLDFCKYLYIFLQNCTKKSTYITFYNFCQFCIRNPKFCSRNCEFYTVLHKKREFYSILCQ